MQLIDREYRSTQPLAPEQDEQRTVYRTRAGRLPAAPRNGVQALMAVVRMQTTLALITPVLVGAALAWWQTGAFNLMALFMAMAGLTLSGWGFAALSDHADYQFSLRPGIRPVPDPLYSGYGLMERGVLRPETVRDLGRILLTIAALCSLWLAVIAGWPILFFSGLSFVSVWAAILLPQHFGARGWGLGEAGVFGGLGLLPLLSSYFVQSRTLSLLPLIIGFPFALLILVSFFNYNTVYFRRDWLIHKRTLTVNLGLDRALDISALVTVITHIGILLGIVLTDLPLSALAALAALPIGLGVFAQLDREALSQEACLRVYQTSVNAVAIAGALFCAALLADKLF